MTEETKEYWTLEDLESLGIDPNKLYVTVFDGDANLDIPRDEEAIAIWQRLFADVNVPADVAYIGTEAAGYERGMKDGERIFSYEAKKNNLLLMIGPPRVKP